MSADLSAFCFDLLADSHPRSAHRARKPGDAAAVMEGLPLAPGSRVEASNNVIPIRGALDVPASGPIQQEAPDE